LTSPPAVDTLFKGRLAELHADAAVLGKQRSGSCCCVRAYRRHHYRGSWDGGERPRTKRSSDEDITERDTRRTRGTGGMHGVPYLSCRRLREGDEVTQGCSPCVCVCFEQAGFLTFRRPRGMSCSCRSCSARRGVPLYLDSRCDTLHGSTRWGLERTRTVTTSTTLHRVRVCDG
jgi:hypothetical protein